MAVTRTTAAYRVRLADGTSAIIKDPAPIGMADGSLAVAAAVPAVID